MLQLAEASNDGELVCNGHGWRLIHLLELGDVQAVDAAIAAYGQAADRLQEPAYLYYVLGYRIMRAILDGRFTEAERLAQQALATGQRLQTESVAGTFGLQMFTLCRERGGLRALEPAVRQFVRQHGAISAWRPGLALIYCELGHERDARLEFEHLAQHDFTDLPHDTLWVGCIMYLTEVCAFLGDTDRATILYQILLPYAGRTVFVGGQIACYGAASRYLGMLAATMERWQEAEQHFQDALAMNARMGARPWLAHTQYQYARMLQTRNQPGDREKAVPLLDEAFTTARELGMHTLAARITGQQGDTAAPAPAPHDLPDALSRREVEVLQQLAAGKSNRDIADTLCISLNTVATHVRNILAKTGCANRTEAAAYALRHGVPEA
jgi:DNA-binding CsgD family transcriptional regulator